MGPADVTAHPVSAPKPHIVVDTTGLFCPVPVLKTSDAIRSLDVGGVVEVISDDPAIEFDLPAWCRSQGHTIESVEKRGNVFHYYVRKWK